MNHKNVEKFPRKTEPKRNKTLTEAKLKINNLKAYLIKAFRRSAGQSKTFIVYKMPKNLLLLQVISPDLAR